MSSISMVEAELPPGFRFHPKDEELICDYLLNKINTHNNFIPLILILEVDLNKCEPWDIPETACVGGKDWYFYSQRDRKYATGLRTNRATASGYWKATGKDKHILRRGTLVGMRKTLVFYQGRAPKGNKTHWVMHEFRLEGPSNISSLTKEDWVLCKVFNKNREAIDGSMGLSHYSTNTSSAFIPPFMDSYINFDQTIDDSFSNISPQNQISTNGLQIISPMNFGDPLIIHTDKVMMEGVFDQFAKMEPSIGLDQLTSQTYLTQVGIMPNVWNPSS